MTKRTKFDVLKLKGKLGKIRDRMTGYHLPPVLLFILMGVISAIWFLIRVIPKPSRATYPCMQIAAPFMSGLVIYLLSVGGLTLISRKLKRKSLNVRYASTFLLIFGVMVTMAIVPSSNSDAILLNTGPEDGPNQPIGKAVGIKPGGVVWAWNPEATNENCTNTFDKQDWFWKPENTNPEVVKDMVRKSMTQLTGKASIAASWDALFKYHNKSKYNKAKGYKKGEKIFIKINQNTSRVLIRKDDKNDGYHVPDELKPGEEKRKTSYGSSDTGPFLVLELLRELVNEAGVSQSDIAIGDPMCPLFGHNYDLWFNEFPGIAYIDRLTSEFGRTLVKPTTNDLVFYSDKTQNDKLFDIIENADYLINVASLKPHTWAGITLNAKNLYGAQARTGAGHLHYSLVASFTDGKISNGGYHKYRALVDLMGSRYLGRNTMLFIVDGLTGGGSGQNSVPVKYFMSPFNNDWSNSIFISQDQVALESVCYDFLRAEWNGINTHDKRNNRWETMPNASGVDDYLHQAADYSNWPDGIIYDPDNSGKPIPSLGVHEHWNNADNKQYSGNLGLTGGIELISIPESLVKSKI